MNRTLDQSPSSYHPTDSFAPRNYRTAYQTWCWFRWGTWWWRVFPLLQPDRTILESALKIHWPVGAAPQAQALSCGRCNIDELHCRLQTGQRTRSSIQAVRRGAARLIHRKPNHPQAKWTTGHWSLCLQRMLNHVPVYYMNPWCHTTKFGFSSKSVIESVNDEVGFAHVLARI